uniref:Ig-like domain-containing protein n=1 Tax=Neogobius melanostomus TaxID=47308 RepID=A0A8C6WN72_9GOBI
MDLATLCTFVASLRVEPNRVQFFQYETVSLSCGDQTEDPQWTIVRNTSKHKNQRNSMNKSSWFFNGNIYYRDTGVYWCQSEEGECGAAINITVTGGDVILESPVLPVTEGERVTLRCIANPNEPALEETFDPNEPALEETFDPNEPALEEGTFDFFKDSLWIRNSSSGNLTLSNVSVLDSGTYMCRYAEQLSAESRLLVVKAAGRPRETNQGEITDTFTTSIIIIVFPVTVILALFCLALVCVRRKRKEHQKPDVIYANVPVVHAPDPRRLKDLQAEDESTFYSNLQLSFMQ